jgi:hypothetical protein
MAEYESIDFASNARTDLIDLFLPMRQAAFEEICLVT